MASSTLITIFTLLHANVIPQLSCDLTGNLFLPESQTASGQGTPSVGLNPARRQFVVPAGRPNVVAHVSLLVVKAGNEHCQVETVAGRVGG